jgi:hypothetical protein
MSVCGFPKSQNNSLYLHTKTHSQMMSSDGGGGSQNMK